jgi:hypothetical protein
VNINWLAQGNEEAMQLQYNAARKVFDALVTSYDIADPGRLEGMILEAVGAESSGLGIEKSRLRQKNGMISYQQFSRLLERYQFETDDNNIGRVPWKKFFTFSRIPRMPEENRIVGDYLPVELLSVLFDMDIETLKEEWAEAEGALKELLSSRGIPYDKALYADRFVDRSRCEVAYDYEGERFRFAFIDIEGEVKEFEFYGKE